MNAILDKLETRLCVEKSRIYIVLGGGHAWPGSKFSATTGPTTFEIKAIEPDLEVLPSAPPLRCIGRAGATDETDAGPGLGRDAVPALPANVELGH